MQNMKKTALLWLIGSVVGLYTTFVLQNLWNWFVTEAFHLSQISFWIMYGVVLVIGMFTENINFVEDQRFKALVSAVDACIPDEKRESVDEQLESLARLVWLDAGFVIFGKVTANTLTLLIGWGVHIFLA